MGGIQLTSFIVLFDVQKIENVSVCVCVCVCVCAFVCVCVCLCVCVCVIYHVTTQGFPLPNCHSLSHSSELAPQL